MSWAHKLFTALLATALSAWAAGAQGPWIHRIEPLGGQRAQTVVMTITGENLIVPGEVWFDSPAIRWIETDSASAEAIVGKISIAADAALGPHLFHWKTREGRTNTRLFNVVQYPGVPEVEPNDVTGQSQSLGSLRPQVVMGYLKDLPDIDTYLFEARRGERWVFDVRSLEYGSHLECEMAMTGESGERVAFNDDRDDYLETPFLEHTFARDGRYQLSIQQYRGPQRVDCNKNCGYMLQVSQLPVVNSINRLGLRVGSEAVIELAGHALGEVNAAYLQRIRPAEYYRLTFPYTIPMLLIKDDGDNRVPGKILARSPEKLKLNFTAPATAPAGLWRLWLESPDGSMDTYNLEFSTATELSEDSAKRQPWRKGQRTVNGFLSADREEDSYWVEASEGVPIHVYTFAVQLGLPEIDTVLELFDESGKLVAEHDDLMTGQGTPVGNPDSSLYYTPTANGRLKLVVRDRIGRGGPGYAYRLKFSNALPGFQLLTEPEEFRLLSGGKAQLEVLLIREPGFEGAVEVWAEGLPPGVTATQAEFRQGQYFGPSGDGDNVVIPTAHLELTAPPGLPPGEYPIQVKGRASGTMKAVEAITTLWIGPPGKRNDIRRPLPAITITVGPTEPEPANQQTGANQ